MGRKALFLCAAALCLLLTGCGAQATPTPSGTPEPTPTPVPAEFSLPYYADASLHPITGQSRTNLTLSSLVYEGLFSLDNTFTASPVLAERWTVSEDGLTWTFTLAQAAFSDGSPLTAAEAADSLELARTSALYAGRLDGVRAVRAQEGALVVELTRPNAALPALLDIPIVKETEGTAPLGTGRYAYAGGGETLYLKKTAVAAAGLPDTIPLTQIRGADDLIYAFDTKEVSLVTADLTGTDSLGYSGGCEVWDYPTTDRLYLGFRTDKGPCADPTLRQAISLALDRDTVVTALFARHARAAVLPVPPESPLYDEKLAAELAYSPQKAAELLAEGGYTLREGKLYRGRTAVSLELLVNTDNSFKLSAAEYLAGELEKLGLSVSVVKLSWQDYTDRLTRGEFDLYLGETVLKADFDLAALVGSSGPLNYGRWADGEADALLERFRSAGSGARPAAASALYETLAREAPIVPICFKNQSVLTQWGQVTGLSPTRADPFAGDQWRIAQN